MSLQSSAINRFRICAICFLATVSIGVVRAKAPNRLIGGSDAALGEIVYQVSLRLHGKHHCGGALVSTKHVLTAAHCVANLADPCQDLTAVTGTNSLEIGGVESLIDDVQIHESFRSNRDGSRSNDIALLTLVGDIDVNTYQSPIDLPEADCPDHAVGVVSGWGYKTYDSFPDGDFSTILQKTDMTILTNEECQRLHKWNMIRHENMCGMKNGFSGICKGDGGSPLVHNGSIVGIASWYYPCALGLPDVYTRVHYYLRWILDNMSKSFYDDSTFF